jgi:hypothetical protein
MSFFNFGNNASKTSVSFGANLPVGNKALSTEISEVGQKFVKTNTKYRTEIDKYKKIAEFNKKLSSSYIANIHAIVDVSKLLNDYALFFNILKEEINKTEGQIGTLETSDIQYLENLTKAKMDEFSNKFIEQSEKVRSLYAKYGQTEEAKTISSAQEKIKTTLTNAEITYKSLLNSTPVNSTSGGAARKKRVAKKKTKLKAKKMT